MADLDKRLADENRALKARADAAEAKAKDTERENKRLKAQQRETVVDANRHIGALNSMRDLAQGPENPFAEDATRKYEELKRTTLIDKAGNAYYFTDGPAHINGVYYVGARAGTDQQKDFIVVMPKDQDPSVTFLPTELAGTDPKTGQPILRPLGTGAKQAAALQARDSDAASQFITNSEINARQEQQRKDAAKLGPGAPLPTGAKQDEQKPADGSRPSDTQVG